MLEMNEFTEQEVFLKTNLEKMIEHLNTVFSFLFSDHKV